MTVAEDIRSEIEALEIPHASNFPPGVVTASLGQATAQDEWLSIAELVGAADSALYAAKERGRNQVCGELAISSSSPVH
jgi:diguanylate cyclase (GGDEF)-like protein